MQTMGDGKKKFGTPPSDKRWVSALSEDIIVELF